MNNGKVCDWPYKSRVGTQLPKNIDDATKDRLAATLTILIVQGLSATLLEKVNPSLEMAVKLGLIFVNHQVAPKSLRKGVMIGASSVLTDLLSDSS